MLRRLAFFRKNLAWNSPIFVLFGLLSAISLMPHSSKQPSLRLTILMIYPMMVTLDVRSVFANCNCQLQAAAQTINFVFIPLLATVLGKLFFAERPLTALGLFLMALLPTSGMTVSWTGFAKGNVPVAIKMTIIGLVLGALATPLFVQTFMGEAVEVSVKKTFEQIGYIVFVPLLFGYLTRTFLIRRHGEARFKKEIKPLFSSVATLAVLGIVFVAMALKARTIINNRGTILGMILPLILLCPINSPLASVAGKFFFARRDAIALVYGCVVRNLSVALAISLVAFGNDGIEVALIIAVAFVIQVQAAARYITLAYQLLGGPQPGLETGLTWYTDRCCWFSPKTFPESSALSGTRPPPGGVPATR